MEGKKTSKPRKEKRRNTEKRKEKSRDAARCRRSRETEIFTDLSDALPLSAAAVANLDKASIMRLAICYLKVRSLIHMVPEQVATKCDLMCDPLVRTAVDGFLLVLSADGDMVFLSENVQDYLGVNQLDMMGHSIYEFSHPCDHDEIKEILSGKSVASGGQRSVVPRSSFLRMKCTLTSKGRNVNLKSASYKVIHYTGHMLTGPTLSRDDEDSDSASCSGDSGVGSNTVCAGQNCLVAIGEPIPHPSNIEIPLDKQTFLSKHSLDMRFTYADDKIGEFLGYSPSDLVGKSIYEFHHAMDSDVVEKGFKCLFSKGQCQSGRFRFLAKRGGYVWVVTQATVLYAPKGHKPQSVVCVNFVISGIEERDEIFSSSQLSAPAPAPAPVPAPVPAAAPAPRPQSVTATLFKSVQDSPASPAPPAPSLRPQAATAKIFAPRTEDMNKGFLMFSEDEGLTMLKDEPEDLTHLAPTAGDVCVPLEGPFLGDMFDDFMLSDNYCPLLSDDSSNSKFFLYRDSDPSAADLSPTLSSTLSKSPGDCSLPSLCSPSRAVDLDDNMNAFMSLSVDTGMTSLSDTDDDLSLRAPYIPMGEDLPLIMSNDLMWGSSLPYKSTSNSSRSSSSGSSSSRCLDDCGDGDNSNSSTNLSRSLDSSRNSWSPLPQTSNKPDLNSSLARLLQSDMTSQLSHRQSGSDLVDPCEVLGQIYSKKQSPSSWSSGRGPGRPTSLKTVSGSGPPHTHKRGASSIGQYLGAKRSRLNLAASRSKKSHADMVHPSDAVLVLDGGGSRRESIPQPSDSVLMNLLGQDGLFKLPIQKKDAVVALGNLVASASSILRELARDKIPDDAPIVLHQAKPPEQVPPRLASFVPTPEGSNLLRKNSFSLLDPDGMIPSLGDLSQQDYDVNAPLSSQGSLLQGEELLTALEMSGAMG